LITINHSDSKFIGIFIRFPNYSSAPFPSSFHPAIHWTTAFKAE
jgi:hypothetical protein